MSELLCCSRCTAVMQKLYDWIRIKMFGNSNDIYLSDGTNKKYFSAYVNSKYPRFVEALNTFFMELLASCVELMFESSISTDEMENWMKENKPGKKSFMNAGTNREIIMNQVAYIITKGTYQIMGMCDAIFFAHESGLITKQTKLRPYDVIGSLTGIEGVVLRIFLTTEYGVNNVDIKCSYSGAVMLCTRSITSKDRKSATRRFVVGGYKRNNGASGCFDYVLTLNGGIHADAREGYKGSIVEFISGTVDIDPLKDADSEIYFTSSVWNVPCYLPPLCRCDIEEFTLVAHDLNYIEEKIDEQIFSFKLFDETVDSAVGVVINNRPECSTFIIPIDKIQDDFTPCIMKLYIQDHKIENVVNGEYLNDACNCYYRFGRGDVPSRISPFVDGTLHRKLDKRGSRVIFKNNEDLLCAIARVKRKIFGSVYPTGMSYDDYYATAHVMRLLMLRKDWDYMRILYNKLFNEVKPCVILLNHVTKTRRYVKNYHHYCRSGKIQVKNYFH